MAIAKPTVLIVDDDINTVSMLNDTLDEAGFTVLVALEGNQALSITSQITPDIILLDAVMPHLDGFSTSSACGKIRAAAYPDYFHDRPE
jgi:DNA-binding response OmpR family regulator